MARTFHITTLGCPKNEADTRAMEDSLLAQGLQVVAAPEDADVHVINSCAFIEEARLETIDTVFGAASLKSSRAGQKLVLAGCFAERYAKEVRLEMPEVDFSFGTGRYGEAGPLIAEAFAQPWSLLRPEPSQPSVRTMPVSVPVKISDGCDRTCAFCAIPLFRGPFRDRSVADILAEVHRLSEQGVREVCLVSQDSNAYGGKAERFVELIDALHEVEDLAWIRLLYLYPDTRTEALLRAVQKRTLPKLVPYFEAPVQHTSPRMLRAMRRAGSHQSFRDLFALAREVWPEAEVRTTFLLGFPGEQEEDVEDLLRFLEEARPEKLALFPYSPEEGTSGALLTEHVDAQLAALRINRVREAHLGLLKGIHQWRVGRVYDCLVEEVGDQVIGRRPQDAPESDEVVYLEEASAARVGDILRVRISGFFEYDMTAVPTAFREPA